MEVNRSIYMKLYKLFLYYTYPFIIANTTNNRIYRFNSDSYWIGIGEMVIFYGSMGSFAINLPINHAIRHYYEPLSKVESSALYFSYVLMWIPLVYLLHRRNRIKPLFNRMKVIPLEEVKAIKKRYTVRFIVYYIIPFILAAISSLFFP